MGDKNLNFYDGNEEYEFYEEDIEDINTGEIKNFSDTPPTIGLVAGVALILFLLTAIGLMGAIYHRDHSSVTLSHLIILCILVLVAAFGAFVCF